MSDSVTITINVPSQIIYNCIKLLSKEHEKPKEQKQVIVCDKEEKTNDDYLKDILDNLLHHCRQSGKFNTDDGRIIIDLLSSITILSANTYNNYIDFLSSLDKYDYVYQEVIFSYMKKKINNSAYNSYIEDGEEGLSNIVNLLIDAYKKDNDEEINDILKEYHDSKEVKEVNDEVKDEVKEDFKIDSSYLAMLKNMDDNTFNNILDKMGMIEESRQKAYKIRNDVREGNALDMHEIYTFVQEFKQNIGDSNIDFSSLLTMFSPKKEEKKEEKKEVSDNKNEVKKEEKPAENTFGGFDLNNIINTLGPMLNNMNGGNRAGKRNNNRNNRRR